jgi:hypothetical protein
MELTLDWLNLAALEVCGTLMLAYLGVMFLERKCLLQNMLALRLIFFIFYFLTLSSCSGKWILPDWDPIIFLL